MSNNRVPPADLLLDLMNDEKDRRTDLIEFYDNYMKAASVITTFNQYGICEIHYMEDMTQEMRINLVRSVPVLRRKLINMKVF